MSSPRPQWIARLMAAWLLCAWLPCWAWAQIIMVQPIDPSFEQVQESRLMDNRDRGFRGSGRDRGLSESVRRFGREHQGVRILSVEPILIEGRSLNRIKALDAQGRVSIWIDDPQSPRPPVRHLDDHMG